MKRKNVASLLALAVGLASGSVSIHRSALAQGADPFVMVVNKNNGGISPMNKVTARKLLLGEIANWPNGWNVVIVLKPVGSGDRVTVLGKVCGMSEAEFTRHNLQAMFMGETVASAQQEASAAAVRNFVKANLGAMSFLHKSEVDENVKVVWTLE
jgi:ABC-type phosphate transport system substrate-binding protein